MASAQPQQRTYRREEVIAFRKTREAWGGLSNMAAGYPLRVADVRIATSEALYQACRFPHLPRVQEMIIGETSPMTAKMRSKPYRSQSRSDWEQVRIPIMKWCLRVKLAQNWEKFGTLLLDTEDSPIVEDSSKDGFWGAIRDEAGVFHGRNVLGRLLMELREILKSEPEMLRSVAPPPIPEFTLFGRDIPEISATAGQQSVRTGAQHDLLEITTPEPAPSDERVPATASAQAHPSDGEPLPPPQERRQAQTVSEERSSFDHAPALAPAARPDERAGATMRWGLLVTGAAVLAGALIWFLFT